MSKGYSPCFSFIKSAWEEYEGNFSVSGKNATLKTLTHVSAEPNVYYSSIAFDHEFAHMVHYALDLKIGTSQVKTKWDSCGFGGYISDYAATSYREDFAETVAYIICNDTIPCIWEEVTGILFIFPILYCACF